MDTKTTTRKRRPLYKRKGFWVTVAAIVLVAAGAAAFFLTKEAGVSLDPKTDSGEGQIEVYTSPKEATIIVDGKERQEKSPAKFSVPLGKHTVTLKLDGYDSVTVPVDVVATNPVVLQQTFTKDGKISANQKPAEFGTYTNEKYKYRVKYPDSWEVGDDSPEAVNFYNKNKASAPEAFRVPLVPTAVANGEEETSLSILVQPNPGDLKPAEWYKARPEYAQEDQTQIKVKELTVNGRPAFQYETPYGFVPYLNTVVTGNGHVYILQQIQNSPERETYDQVIQTFTLF